MNYFELKELAQEYNDFYLFYEGIEEFINEKRIEQKDIKLFNMYVMEIHEADNTNYIVDRIQREFKENEVVKLVDGSNFCIIHKCSKKEGLIQCSIFDKAGAVGDFVQETIYQIAKHLVENYRNYKFEDMN